MPTYISLINWTDQGISNVQHTVQRGDRVQEIAQKHGARLEQQYWTLGPYDVAVIFKAPDDGAASAFRLELSTEGHVRSTTLRAYDREEMIEIIGRIG